MKTSVVNQDSFISLNPDPNPAFQVNPYPEKLKKLKIFIIFFWSKIAIYLFLNPRSS
jgi:hypothetical protein